MPKIDVERIKRGMRLMNEMVTSPSERVEWMFRLDCDEIIFAGEVVNNNHFYSLNELRSKGVFKLRAFAGDVLYVYGAQVELTPEELKELFRVYEERI
jgi:hypothetical protein